MALASSKEITEKILKLDEVEENVYRFKSKKLCREKSFHFQTTFAFNSGQQRDEERLWWALYRSVNHGGDENSAAASIHAQLPLPLHLVRYVWLLRRGKSDSMNA